MFQLEKHTGKPKYPNISALAKAVLLIPHSNTECERVFSHGRKMRTEFRSSTGRDALSAMCVLNSLRPRDVIWRHRSGSTLAQVMACCLTAPSHYLNQCWLIISKVLRHSSGGNFIRYVSHHSLKLAWKITFLKLDWNFSWANESSPPVVTVTTIVTTKVSPDNRVRELSQQCHIS